MTRQNLRTAKLVRVSLCIPYFLLHGLLSGYALAQNKSISKNGGGSYPDKPINLYSATSTVGESGVLAPLFAKLLSKHMNVKVNMLWPEKPGIIDNFQKIVQKPADGYHLLISSQNSLILYFAQQSRYNQVWDKWYYLDIVLSQPRICLVAKNSRIRDFPHLIELIRESPKSIRHLSKGAFSAMYLPAYLLRQYGLRYDHISRVWGKESVSLADELVADLGDFTCLSPTLAIPEIRSGKVRPIFINSPQPLPGFADLNYPKNTKQLGSHRLQFWWALASPQKLPKDIEAKIMAAIRKIATDKEWLESDSVKYAVNTAGRVANPNQFVAEEAAFYENLAILLRLVK